MDAPTNNASAPVSFGAEKSILPNWSASTTVSSAVVNFKTPAVAVPVPAGPRHSFAFVAVTAVALIEDASSLANDIKIFLKKKLLEYLYLFMFLSYIYNH
jgi:hypothetical protein